MAVHSDTIKLDRGTAWHDASRCGWDRHVSQWIGRDGFGTAIQVYQGLGQARLPSVRRVKDRLSVEGIGAAWIPMAWIGKDWHDPEWNGAA